MLKDHYKRDRREVERQARDRRTRELLAFWGKLTFSAGEQVPGAFAARVDWPSLHLADNQKRLAMNRIGDVIAYLENPSLQEYYRLKTEGLHYAFKPSPRATHVLARSNRQVVADDLRSTVAAVWERMSGERPPCLTGICLDNIAAITTTTNNAAAMLGGKLSKSFTIAYDALDPGFQYQTGAAQSTAKQLFLNLSFFARSSTSTNPGPVHISLLWSDADGTWALHKMLTDVHLNLNTMF
jgi:hypothetical protein